MNAHTTSTESAARGRPTWLLPAIAGVVIIALVAVGLAVFSGLGKRTIHAEFLSTSGLYEGDDVRVLGVSVGKISDIDQATTSCV